MRGGGKGKVALGENPVEEVNALGFEPSGASKPLLVVLLVPWVSGVFCLEHLRVNLLLGLTLFQWAVLAHGHKRLYKIYIIWGLDMEL